MVEIKEGPSLGAADTERIYEGLLATDPAGQPRRYAPPFLSLRDTDSRLMGGVLDTFDFEARAFYERPGYVVYAQLDKFPAGHVQLHMLKVLSPVG